MGERKQQKKGIVYISLLDVFILLNWQLEGKRGICDSFGRDKMGKICMNSLSCLLLFLIDLYVKKKGKRAYFNVS